MNRRSFLRKSCAVCIGAMSLSSLSGCKSVHYITGTLTDDGIVVPVSDFMHADGSHRLYVIIRHPALQYPVCVYRLSEQVYTALWMACTHQGATLQVAGDRLVCPAHNSEFDARGAVRQGPAMAPLRTFPVRPEAGQLFIDLRKQS